MQEEVAKLFLGVEMFSCSVGNPWPKLAVHMKLLIVVDLQYGMHAGGY